MGNEPFIVKWYEGPKDDRTVWFCRSIHPSGKFFGEVCYLSQQSQQTIAGNIAQPDLQSMFDLVEKIRRSVSKSESKTIKLGWSGLLAAGTVAKPEIVLHYYDGDEDVSEDARWFLELIDLLRPHVKAATS